MSFSSRILGTLEREFGKQLSFTFHDLSVENPGRLTLQDPVSFTIWVRNDAEFPLTAVWGLIEPAKFLHFASVRFKIDQLGAGEAKKVASISAIVVASPGQGAQQEPFGKVDFSATPDLSGVVFAEWERPLRLAADASVDADESATIEHSPSMHYSTTTPSFDRLERRPIPAGAIPLSKLR